MKLLVFPRDPNPYQELLYEELKRYGVKVSYLGDLTPSRTVNLLLMPLEMAARRLGGTRLIHLHWVFGFQLPGSARFPALRRLAQQWFAIWLRTARLLGFRLAWTAHNVLPHTPVFADDAAARRTLVSHSDLVFIHSNWTLNGLAELGAVPRRAVQIKHGPFHPPVPVASLRSPGGSGAHRRFLFLGKVQEYKGVEDLLEAFTAVHADEAPQLTIAGQCDDPVLRKRILESAHHSKYEVILHLEYLTNDTITGLLSAADIVVLPFRRVTTSGSAMLALAHGRPLIVTDLPALADLPQAAVRRYDGTVAGLAEIMSAMAVADLQELGRMSAAAVTYAAGMSWRDAAHTTFLEFRKLVKGADGMSSDLHEEAARA